MDEWLTVARDELAATAAMDSNELELSADDVRRLLDAARLAARESGARTNAPLLCYLLGRASTRCDLSELTAALQARSP